MLTQSNFNSSKLEDILIFSFAERILTLHNSHPPFSTGDSSKHEIHSVVSFDGCKITRSTFPCRNRRSSESPILRLGYLRLSRSQSSKEMSTNSKKSYPSYFPEELIIQILVRLPAMSLVRFRSVSRSWRSMISSPAFMSSHIDQQTKDNNTRILCIWDSKNHRVYMWNRDQSFEQCLPIECPIVRPIVRETHVQSFWLSFIEDRSSKYYYYENLYIAGSCNGLICLYDKQSIKLWNPSIRQTSIIWLPQAVRDQRDLQWGCPSSVKIVTKAVGFGFDVVSNDHKVVWIARDLALPKGPPDRSYFAEVYSLNFKRWKKRCLPKLCDYEKIIENPAFVNGVIHWVLYGHWYDTEEDMLNYVSGRPGPASILALNVHDEEFGRMMLPHSMSGKGTCHLTVVEGLLAAMQDDQNCEWSIWVMKDYQVFESWTMTFKVHGTVLCLRSIDEALIVEKNKKANMTQLFSEDTHSKLVVHEEKGLDRWCSLAYDYVESLIHLDARTIVCPLLSMTMVPS
ncbi:hypothetical protein Droror1_Dr00020829 [Drosera rotundifolia]